MDQLGWAAKPASCSWSTELENEVSLCLFVPENLVPRDIFGCPVPRLSAHLPHSG